MLSKQDKEGYLTKYAYTKQGDVDQNQCVDGREVKLSYNPLSQLTLIEDWIGSIKITLDVLGRAGKIVYPDGRRDDRVY